MKILNKIWILLIAATSPVILFAQMQATLSIDTNAILIGDQTNLELTFEVPVDTKVSWPVIGDTITSEIEVLDRTPIDTVFTEDQSRLLLRQKMRITSFDSGYFAIPPIRFNWQKPGDTTIHFTETEPLLLGVSTLPVNMEEEIKDIKDPIRAPYTFREALPWIIGFVLALVMGFFTYYYIRKRKKAEPIFKVTSKLKLPPHRIALDAFEGLRFKKLWQSGQIKEYHTELTEIIREYILGRFSIHALEFTSDEIMEAINNTNTNSQAKEKLRITLLLADMVKFAKEQPLPLEHDASLNNAIDFVKETMQLVPDKVSEELATNNLTNLNKEDKETITSEKLALSENQEKVQIKKEEGKDV